MKWSKKFVWFVIWRKIGSWFMIGTPLYHPEIKPMLFLSIKIIFLTTCTTDCTLYTNYWFIQWNLSGWLTVHSWWKKLTRWHKVCFCRSIALWPREVHYRPSWYLKNYSHFKFKICSYPCSFMVHYHLCGVSWCLLFQFF